MCKSGRYRSVRLGELLFKSLQIGGLTDVVITHLSERRLRRTRCQQSGPTCPKCNNQVWGHWMLAEAFTQGLDREWQTGMNFRPVR